MGNIVKYGLNNVYYAVLTDNDGTITYGTPKAIKGGVKISLDPEGDEVKFRADNSDYYKNVVNNGYKGSLELAMITSDFYKDCLGLTEDSNGALIESKNNVAKRFALMFEFEGDKTGSRVVLYDCLASRPKAEHSTTEDTVSPETDTLDFSAGARTSDGKVKATLTKTDTNTTVYNGFFTTVYEEAQTRF